MVIFLLRIGCVDRIYDILHLVLFEPNNSDYSFIEITNSLSLCSEFVQENVKTFSIHWCYLGQLGNSVLLESFQHQNAVPDIWIVLEILNINVKIVLFLKLINEFTVIVIKLLEFLLLFDHSVNLFLEKNTKLFCLKVIRDCYKTWNLCAWILSRHIETNGRLKRLHFGTNLCYYFSSTISLSC